MDYERDNTYNWLDCSARVLMYKSKKQAEQSLKITTLELDHSHPISEEIYNLQTHRLSEDQIDTVKKLN